MKTALVLIAAFLIVSGANAQSIFENTSNVPYLYTAHNPTERVVITPEIRRWADSLSIDRDVSRSERHLYALVNSRKGRDGRYEAPLEGGGVGAFSDEGVRVTKKQLDALISAERKNLKALKAKRSELLSVR